MKVLLNFIEIFINFIEFIINFIESFLFYCLEPKEHVGCIDLRSFSSKSVKELFEELEKVGENLNLAAIRVRKKIKC